jgi:signal transduction histidine kinase
VARHAAARSVRVLLEVDAAAGVVSLVVDDDGTGLHADRVTGQGTTTMSTRAARHGGACRFEPGTDGGTRVVWTAPLDLDDHSG